jgi:hypothetical protein
MIEVLRVDEDSYPLFSVFNNCHNYLV